MVASSMNEVFGRMRHAADQNRKGTWKIEVRGPKVTHAEFQPMKEVFRTDNMGGRSQAKKTDQGT